MQEKRKNSQDTTKIQEAAGENKNVGPHAHSEGLPSPEKPVSGDELQQKQENTKTIPEIEDSDTREVSHRGPEPSVLSQAEADWLKEKSRLNRTIENLKRKYADGRQEFVATAKELEKCRKERKVAMEELGSLQTEYAMLNGRYEATQRLYQEARGGSYDEGAETVQVRKLFYQQMKSRLRVLEQHQDAEVNELQKEVRELRAIQNYHESQITNLKEENFRLSGSNEELLEKANICFKQISKATKQCDRLYVLNNIMDLTRSELRTYITASSSYSNQYSDMALERERAKWKVHETESQMRKFEEVVEAQANLLRLKQESLNDAEIEAESVRMESTAREREQADKMCQLDQLIVGLKEEIERLKLAGVGERTKQLLAEHRDSVEGFETEKRELKEEVMKLSASLQLRQMFEIERWVEAAVADEAKKDGEEVSRVERPEVKESEETEVGEESSLGPNVATIQSVYQWIREKEIERAAAQMEDRSGGEWEDETF